MGNCNLQDKPERTVFKQYDTIEFDCYMRDDDGSIYDLTGLTLIADMISKTGETELMTTVITDAIEGQFVIKADSKKRDVGKYQVDVLMQLDDDDYKSSKDSFEFYIERAISAPRTNIGAV